MMKFQSAIAAERQSVADKKEGPFELHVDWIRTYGGDDATPSEGP